MLLSPNFASIWPNNLNSGPTSRMLRLMVKSLSFSKGNPSHEISDTYPGKERPGIPSSKSGILPEPTSPEILATTLKFALTLPSNTTQSLSTLSIAITRYNTPKFSPNSLMAGGMSVPAATAPRPTDICTLAPTSRETEALGDIGIAALAGHSMLLLNTFVTPEKSIGVGFD